MSPRAKHSALPPFAADESPYCPYDSARVVVLPVPYEGTVSYGQGASNGPRMILEASSQLERYDPELDWCIDEAGLHTLEPPVLRGLAPNQVERAIYQAALPPARDGKLLLTLGGEHSVSEGVLNALLEAREGRPFSVLQIDAHADLRESFQGTPHSHACVMARAFEMGLHLVQVGLRAVSEEERGFMREKGIEDNVFWAHDIARRDTAEWVTSINGKLKEEVYITLDLDGLDPAIMPATGTPVPGGLGWYQTLHLLRSVSDSHRIIGLDVVELAPIVGQHAPNFLAAQLAYKALGYALFREFHHSPLA